MQVASKPSRVAIFGTFDVENYGDLMFPLVAASELSERLGRVELTPFSYHAKKAGAWPYDVTSVVDFPAMVESFDLVLIGGGHLIRFDKVVAHDYEPPSRAIHHPTGYWLGPALAAVAAGVPVVWNAPSASTGTPEWAEPLFRVALEESPYVSVRDELSRDELRRIAPQTSIHVVADTVFGLGRLSDQTFPVPDHPPTPYLVFHSHETVRPLVESIRRDDRFDAYHFVEIPIGPSIGDRLGLLDPSSARESGLATWRHPMEIASLVAKSSGVVTRSLHLSITALSHGRPVLVPDLPVDSKYRLLSESSRVFSGDRVDAAGAFAAACGYVEKCRFAIDSEASTSSHWDRIADIARETGAARPAEAIYAHFFDVHTHLELASDAKELVRARADASRMSDELAHARVRESRLSAERDEAHGQAARLQNSIELQRLTIERLEVVARMNEVERRLDRRARKHRGLARLPLLRRTFRWLRTYDPAADVERVLASGLFDPDDYLARHPECTERGAQLVRRYLEDRASALRNPGPRFDVDFYLRTNSDVAASGVHPLLHYLVHGAREGRLPRAAP